MVLLLGGCAASRPAAEFSYVLNAERPAKAAMMLAGATVYLAPVTADEPYGQRGFVYRETAQRFAVDPYRGYLVPPTRQIDSRLNAWLGAAGATLAADRHKARYTLDARVSALYVDLRPGQPGEAVVTLRLTLGDTGAATRQFSIDGRAPVAPMNGDGIAAATNAALADVLSQLEATLASESRAALR
ncbi:hypothetical protein GCM10007350_01070 [Jeongeupia chitinilytica]|uniref:ABC-type transport auxiliary lipoprotein component domain-containing protein n=1 Tax=Jeongeupia chitinilytica TaxID=1041641 RepID=A0ABQ3GXB2_9NEIS|nr:hypothetical protein GCM10007350_01070 [Jeongeupia chitinilytica]